LLKDASSVPGGASNGLEFAGSYHRDKLQEVVGGEVTTFLDIWTIADTPTFVGVIS
jgi:hypothetical protein